MKTIGILGGMSAESTQIYYRLANEKVRARLGGLHSADLLIRSVDFKPIADLQANGAWEEAGHLLATEAQKLEAGGADMLLLATNTMHKVIKPIAHAVSLPVIHVADATAEAIKAARFTRPGLMATRFTMEDDFYTGRLRQRYVLDPIVPEAEDRKTTHRIIYEELCQGIVREESRETYRAIAGRLAAAGADCLILGCTEVGMLLNAGNVDLPVFDTVDCHVEAAVKASLGES